MCRKQKGTLRVYETNILEAIFMILLENSSLVANDTQGTSRISTPTEINARTHFHTCDMVVKLPQNFQLPIEELLGHYFLVRSPYSQTAQWKQKTPSPAS